MNKKQIELIILAMLIIATLLIWQTVLKQGVEKKCQYDENLITINTDLEMNKIQEQSYKEIKEKLCEDVGDYSELFHLARLKQDLLDFDGALELYEKLRIIKPKDISILNNMGTIYYNSGNYEKSKEMYLAILDITPKWAPSYNELASIYRYHLKDQAAEFEPILLNGLENYPEMKIDLTAKLAVYYDEVMSNKAKAIEYYEKLLKLDPTNTVVKERLGELK